MKLQTKTIEMTSMLTLTEHETEMLAYLAGYGPVRDAADIAGSIKEASFGG